MLKLKSYFFSYFYVTEKQPAVLDTICDKVEKIHIEQDPTAEGEVSNILRNNTDKNKVNVFKTLVKLYSMLFIFCSRFITDE